ncbi:FeoB-associated Cys-rich membrane protein [Ligilactobacillus apodemi]|uniref:FeoB-associated Cys-rich membrane protein n=1 Tax=Ligilactobacillus apodemi DSM 16634 = JCM 16172 TaxID=1423724 RepID=A0A0R1TYE6_9LACO|nr:FeoB-associated Cys-rich membrane protein [Ligilactobacillus apodemi]KRL86151.1 hypothetical protein FC32_GL002005 [Ligilactobacillus apodemi DSM 16634 = JCM 16172]MBD5069428.1 FeoB-associated Cys-rich membrane protein [Lactobacillus sp.]MCR1902178.1 FeoB-associated Cys-rich membrane protein [Ligilactobacillus apodemi]
MVATVILGVVIFALVARIIYTRFISHKNTDCESCHNVGCPLVDVQKVTKKDKL